MREYKAGINTQHEREILKRLIATIYAKRSFTKARPGAKIVQVMVQTLERQGVLGVGGSDPKAT